MINQENIATIAQIYLAFTFAMLDIKGKKIEFHSKTKRTYHFKLGDIKVSIPIKALREFEEKYK